MEPEQNQTETHSIVRYFYLRDYKRNRHVCVARRLNRETQVVEFAYSVSHPTDTFRKKFARHLAISRLLVKSKKFYCEAPLADLKPLQTVVKYLASYGEGAVKKMAQTEMDFRNSTVSICSHSPWRP